jgi:hypothetical protein
MLRVEGFLIGSVLAVWSVPVCSESLVESSDQMTYQCPGLADEGRISSDLSGFKMVLMDRRARKDFRYQYDFIGIGFFYDSYTKFSAELPDVPEAAVQKYTISSSDTYFVCQERSGAFLFAQKIHSPAVCELIGDVLICKNKVSPTGPVEPPGDAELRRSRAPGAAGDADRGA